MHLWHAGLCCERAQLADGQAILELGCGWGSMCLYMAAKYPSSSITAVSNSSTQKALIDERAKERGLSNLVSFLPCLQFHAGGGKIMHFAET
jgi:cyclopropane fatty-acyl-phospholipid synthase-like methyltransferase